MLKIATLSEDPFNDKSKLTNILAQVPWVEYLDGDKMYWEQENLQHSCFVLRWDIFTQNSLSFCRSMQEQYKQYNIKL